MRRRGLADRSLVGDDGTFLRDLRSGRGETQFLMAGDTLDDGSAGRVDDLELASFTAYLLDMLEVLAGHGGDVLAVEDTDFKRRWRGTAVLDAFLATRGYQIRQRLIDDRVGTDVLRNLVWITVMRHQFAGRREIDPIDVGMTGSDIVVSG